MYRDPKNNRKTNYRLYFSLLSDASILKNLIFRSSLKSLRGLQTHVDHWLRWRGSGGGEGNVSAFPPVSALGEMGGGRGCAALCCPMTLVPGAGGGLLMLPQGHWWGKHIQILGWYMDKIDLGGGMTSGLWP